MTMFDELMDLLADVGDRDCLIYSTGCTLEECEPCRARRLHARMVEAKARVSPQDDAVRTR